MENTKTLTLKKTIKPADAKPKQARPEQAIIGRRLSVQTKSSSRFEGTVLAFEGGWVTIEGTEHRWLPDQQLSGPISSGRFFVDRQNIAFFAEVA